MRRRQFLSFLSGAATWPLVAQAQQTSGRPLIALLSPQPAAAAAPNFEALRRGLREFGYEHGRNIWLESRYAEGALSRLRPLATELVALKPDLIIAGSSAGVLAAQQATQTIPTLFFSIQDPVTLGIAKSIARPGGNATGIWTFGGGDDALVSKRIELLKEIVPGLSRVGVMVSSGDPSDAITLRLLPKATSALGVTYKVFDVATTSELEAAFDQAAGEGIQAVFIEQNPFMFSRRTEIAAMAARVRLPAVYGFREHAEVGGLISYGSSLASAYYQSARLVDKILKGANPGELPIEQATAFELVVNNKTAKALGLKIPESFLVRADEVIE